MGRRDGGGRIVRCNILCDGGSRLGRILMGDIGLLLGVSRGFFLSGGGLHRRGTRERGRYTLS
jgi:hypothetical protein